MKKIYIILMVMLCGCISKDYSAVKFGHSKQFIIQASRSRIVYDYWHRYLLATSAEKCNEHFLESVSRLEKYPQVEKALQVNFLDFLQAHEVK